MVLMSVFIILSAVMLVIVSLGVLYVIVLLTLLTLGWITKFVQYVNNIEIKRNKMKY